MNVGDTVPSLTFHATQGLQGQFNTFRDKWVILYFYPKDATPGCTIEGRDFRDHHADFVKHNAVILGVSRDTLAAHEKFKTKQQFPFELVSDPEGTWCEAFGVIKKKSLFGKQIIGIERSTFLIDPAGIIKHAWRKISIKGHALAVLEILQSLQSSQ